VIAAIPCDVLLCIGLKDHLSPAIKYHPSCFWKCPESGYHQRVVDAITVGGNAFRDLNFGLGFDGQIETECIITSKRISHHQTYPVTDPLKGFDIAVVGTFYVAAIEVAKIPDPLLGVGGFADEFEHGELRRINRKSGLDVVADDG